MKYNIYKADITQQYDNIVCFRYLHHLEIFKDMRIDYLQFKEYNRIKRKIFERVNLFYMKKKARPEQNAAPVMEQTAAPAADAQPEPESTPLPETAETAPAGKKISPAEKPAKKSGGVMKTVSTIIVSSRYIIFVLFIAAAVYCALSINKVKINEDITAFLPDSTETRRGLTIMDEEFVTYASADIMVSNITYETAEKLAKHIEEFDKVSSVTLDNTTTHYKNSSALLSVSFNDVQTDQGVIDTMNDIREYLKDYDTYIYSDIGMSYSQQLANEMGFVILLTAIVIVAVLLFTSRSYFEVVIFGIVFAFAALLNMGTNFWLGEISSITNSIAVILQLALAIDYAIIFSHRYQDEALVFNNHRDALIEALSKSIIEISSSSLTTISGLVALTLMQFKLGRDLGVVLTKGILCSLITVFLLMPGLIMLFPKALRRTAHRSLIPNIEPWGKVLVSSKFCFVWFFLLIIPFSIYFSEKTEYVFSERTIDEIVYSESRASMHKIIDTFDDSTTVAVLVPTGNYNYEKRILKEYAALDDVKSVTGLASFEIDDDHVLTDGYTPRSFAELLDIDIEEADLLFQAYGVEHEEYAPIFGSTQDYEVPLIDMFLYLFEKIDHGVVNLDEETMNSINEKRDALESGIKQLQGENWNRLVLTATVPVEGERSVELTEKLRSIAEKYYGSDTVVLVGDITSTRDLSESYSSDSMKINLLTISFVFVILLFTFRTLAGSLVLVFVIQGSIWINFSFPYLTGLHTSFITNMIVSALQMGATIDYAIVIMNRFQALKAEHSPKIAMSKAVGESFPTVLTSGSILTMAGFLISFRVSDVYVSHIGLAIGRGALISVVLVLTVLPQLILMLDKLIDQTKFTIKPGVVRV